MAKHSVETLTKDLSNFKIAVNQRFSDIQGKIDDMHDYIVEQKGFERGKALRNKDGTINVNKDVWGLIKWLVLIIGALVGVKLLNP